MLQFVIVASNTRDTPAEAAIRPLNARSLALSALLGTHPPTLRGNGLVALAELFGIAPGTMRTALSRMVAAGELEAADRGHYRLVGRLLERQRAQDVGRRAPPDRWDGAWHTAIVLEDRRTLDDRRRARQVLVDHRFAELRPEVWMRPANLPPPVLDDAWALTTGSLTQAPADVAARLWDLDRLAVDALELTARLVVAAEPLGGTDPTATLAAIPAAFHASAAVVRFLRTEPMLPAALLQADWPVNRLRTEYDRVETELQRAMGAFLSRT